MSWVSSDTELVSSAWLSSAYAGHGILGYDIPSAGVSGGSPLLNDGVSSGEEYRWTLHTAPASGTLVIYENTSFDFYGAADGAYSFVYRLYESGVDSGLATVYLNVGPPIATVSATTADAALSSSASAGQNLAFSLTSFSDFYGSASSGVILASFLLPSDSAFAGDAFASPLFSFDLIASSGFAGGASLDMSSSVSFALDSFSMFSGNAEGDLTPTYGDVVRLYSRLATSVFAGDVGTEIIVDCGADVSTATVRNIIARKPAGTRVVWAAQLLTSNLIKYTVVDGDLDVVGNWKLQAYIEMPSGRWSGEVATLFVARPI